MSFLSQCLNSSCSFFKLRKPHINIRQKEVIFQTCTTSIKGSDKITCCTSSQTVVIGLGADSGCGKSTFIKRLETILKGDAEPPKGGNPNSNTLMINDATTIISLDDYRLLDRNERKAKGLTSLDPRANDFDLMYEQVKAIKDGISVEKPIYNHVSGLFDPPELIKPPKVLVIAGLHPMYDERVRALLDFSIYFDVSHEVKIAWKVQEMAEMGDSLESIKASIEARKPDFDAYIDPQKQYADVVLEVLPTKLIPNEKEGKMLRAKLIMKEGVEFFKPVYLFDEGSTTSWIPCGRIIPCSSPGVNLAYGPDTYYGHEVSVLEIDGQFQQLEQLFYVETHLSNISTKSHGEMTLQMLANNDLPGCDNGTAVFQTIIGLKVREFCRKLIASKGGSFIIEATEAKD